MKRRVAIGRLFFSFRGRINRAQWWAVKVVWLSVTGLISPLQDSSIYTILALVCSVPMVMDCVRYKTVP